MKHLPRPLSTPTVWGQRWKRGFSVRWIFGFVGLAVAAACANVDLENAFKGEFPEAKNNSVISGYCQTCHIHKDFDGEDHIAIVRPRYRRPVFRDASECRTCHYLKKDWLHNDYQRKTRLPANPNSKKN